MNSRAGGSVLKATLAVFALLLAIGAYVAYAESGAKKKAVEFCSSVKVGEPAAPLLERARASGANLQQTRWGKNEAGVQALPVTFVALAPLSRHICEIEASNVITKATYVDLD